MKCVCSLLSGTGRACLAGLHRCSPERFCVPCPLLGQPLISVSLDLQERDGGRHSDDALQYLVEMIRP